jgi:hypothetical protein
MQKELETKSLKANLVLTQLEPKNLGNLTMDELALKQLKDMAPSLIARGFKDPAIISFQQLDGKLGFVVCDTYNSQGKEDQNWRNFAISLIPEDSEVIGQPKFAPEGIFPRQINQVDLWSRSPGQRNLTVFEP